MTRVPEFTARAAIVLYAVAFLDEAEFAVESDRRVVVGEDLQRKLMQAFPARFLDRGGEQRRPDATTAPGPRDCHPKLTNAEFVPKDMERSNQVAARDGDDRAVDRGCKLLRPRVDVDRRLRRDPVALLGDNCEQLSQPPRVLRLRRPYLERCHGDILALLLPSRSGLTCASVRECHPSCAHANRRFKRRSTSRDYPQVSSSNLPCPSVPE